jgi:hypothetical protein
MRARARQTWRAGVRCTLGAILAALVLAAFGMGGDARAVEGVPLDAREAGDVSGEEAAVEVAARAELAAEDLSASLRWVAGSMRTAAPGARDPERLTAAENDALIEAAAREQLTGLAEDLDRLSAALAAGTHHAPLKGPQRWHPEPSSRIPSLIPAQLQQDCALGDL